MTGVTGGVIGVENCNDDRLFVVIQNGRILVADSNYILIAKPFLNISNKISCCGEMGLLGVAFHPNYKQNGYFYINYTRNLGSQLQSVVSRFNVSAVDSNRADSLSERVLFTVNQPYANHNGGCMRFGPDGYLYIGFGDGGSGNDPQRNGQNVNTLLGKILRIDVDHDSLYSIPADNPFVGMADHREEIWSYGLRNPWRFSFDRLTGDMWIGDVGQNVWEEVDFEKAGDPGGRNYGWVCYEGNTPNILGGCPEAATMTFPVHVYDHTGGNCSVTGGFVYRGGRIADIFGKYIFADYCNGIVRALDPKDSSITVIGTTGRITSFGENKWGEIHICDATNNRIIRLDPIGCRPVSYIFNEDSLSVCRQNTVELKALEGYAMKFQWYKDSIAINGANDYRYIATDTGKYFVTVYNTPVCSLQSKIVTIGNFPVVDVTIDPVGNICNNADTVQLNAHINGGIFSGEGVEDSLLIPANTTAGIRTIYYNYTDSNNCPFADSTSFEVFAAPDVSVSPIGDVCLNAPPLSLDINPPGGFLSGNGIDTSGNFNALQAGLGQQSVYYSYTDSNSCMSSDSISLNVLPIPSITINFIGNICSNSIPLQLQADPEGGSFGGIGVDSIGYLHPDFVPAGQQTISYSYADSNGCSGIDSISYSILQAPEIDFTTGPVCDNNEPLLLIATPPGGSFLGKFVQNNYLQLDSISGTEQTIYYIYADTSNGCSNYDSTVLDIVQLPQIIFELPDSVCDDGIAGVQFSVTPGGGNFSGDINDINGDVMYFLTDGEMHHVNYTIDVNGCSTSVTDSILVNLCGGIGNVNDKNISIYPNPAMDKIFISTSANIKIESIKISNSIGQEIYTIQTGTKNEVIELNLPPVSGMYIIYMKTGMEEYVAKVFRQ